ncbi:hypothetical protein CRENBAI_021385 [Crenichthys baileyi]|uniref:Uncharacterized protein n=1 Tax=Crenichthys baileyi TaxID=28760 RepID=A0AAV9SH57_9TELE
MSYSVQTVHPNSKHPAAGSDFTHPGRIRRFYNFGGTLVAFKGERLSLICRGLGGQIAIYSIPVGEFPVAARMASNETESDQVALVFLERSHLSH